MKIVIIIISIFFVCSCKNKNAKEKSVFNLEKDITNFSEKMQNGDTLEIFANLSVCMVEQEEKSIITKRNNINYISTFIKGNLVDEIQLKNRIYNHIESDSLNFEDLFKNMEEKKALGGEMNSDIFTIAYKNQKVVFYSDMLVDPSAEYYLKIMHRIYPDEKNYQPLMPPKRFEFIPPKISDSTQTE